MTGILQANNLTLPGGQLSVDGEQIPVSTIGRFESVAQIEDLVVGVRTPTTPTTPTTPNHAHHADHPDDADHPDHTPDPGRAPAHHASAISGRSSSRTSRRPAMGEPTANRPSPSRSARPAPPTPSPLPRRSRPSSTRSRLRHPGEIAIVTIADQSSFILESSEGLLREGGLGAVFAVITIFLFLANVRSTFVAAVSIPLSILAALVIMQAAGITLNILTLGGLAVAVGRVVDDSIVVLENIYRHRALGHDRMTSVLQGPREVASAITASTFTTVAVFLPLGFAGGFVSQFFLSFSLTVTFALLASLVVALTVVPVLAYFLVKNVSGAVDETGEPKNSFWVRLYDPAIRVVLRNRWTRVGTVVVAAVLFVASLATRAAPPDLLHRFGLGEDPAGHRRAADRRRLRAGPRAGREGRGDPPGRPRCRPRRHDRARRRRHRLPDGPRRTAGSCRQQRTDDRAPRSRRSTSRRRRSSSPTSWHP